MSGLVKAVKKVFKKVAKVVKKVLKSKIVRIVLMAAAVYFTAGAAIGAFGGSSIISSMPGWGSTGLFTKAATALGVPGFGGVAPLIGGASTAATTATAASGGMSPALTTTALNPAAAMSNAPIAAQGMSTVAAGNTAANVGLVGKVASGAGKVAGWLGKNPGAAMVLGQGVSGGVQSYMADKTAKEQREHEAQMERERGFFGMDQVGNQIDLPTSGAGIVSRVAAPAVERQATQAEQAQGATAPGDQVAANGAQPAYLTPSQLLELQRRSFIKPPYGSA